MIACRRTMFPIRCFQQEGALLVARPSGIPGTHCRCVQGDQAERSHGQISETSWRAALTGTPVVLQSRSAPPLASKGGPSGGPRVVSRTVEPAGAFQPHRGRSALRPISLRRIARPGRSTRVKAAPASSPGPSASLRAAASGHALALPPARAVPASRRLRRADRPRWRTQR